MSTEAAPSESPSESPSELRNGSRPPALRLGGVVALGVAVFALVTEIVAIVIGSAGQWPLATGLAWAVIGLTIAAAVLGVVAVTRRRGRRWAVAAIALAVVTNPIVQIGVLRVLGGH